MTSEGPPAERGVLVLFLSASAHVAASLVRVPVVDSDIDREIAADLLGGQVQAAYRWQIRTARRARADAGRVWGHCWLYLVAEREHRRLPLNVRAVEMGRRLGRVYDAQGLLGPALVVGTGRGSGPVDVQAPVITEARRQGRLAPYDLPDRGTWRETTQEKASYEQARRIFFVGSRLRLNPSTSGTWHLVPMAVRHRGPRGRARLSLIDIFTDCQVPAAGARRCVRRPPMQGLSALLELVRQRAHLRNGHIDALLVPSLEHLAPLRDGSEDVVRALLRLHFGMKVVEVGNPLIAPPPVKLDGSEFRSLLLGTALVP